MAAILRQDALGFPFACESPFLFAVYHLDRYPAGTAAMGPKASLAGHSLGSDFGHPSGWSMYHGEEVPGFPKHPHRGFETITITRRGLVDHTDSLGNGGRFGYGDVQWMTAGSGISHAEMFPLLDQEKENVLELFQVWINLPKASKMATPSFRMLWRESLPARKLVDPASGGSAEVVLIAGSLPGFDAPPDPPPNSYASAAASQVLVLTLQLTAGGSWTLPAATAEKSGPELHRNIYFFAGDAATIDGKPFKKHAKIKVKPDKDITLSSPSGTAEILVLQGKDINEPVVQHGPFVGNTREDIMQAFSDYQRSGFGGWPWQTDSHCFPREKPRFAQFADGTVEERPIPTAAP
ncbi:hypothetical protein AB1Y20_022277 [Prymnesium parvum]|uniref:Pirin n=1 Tax=Prymnesium parvum TaxID=97485 RepID=A0AB34JIC3_PRYPA